MKKYILIHIIILILLTSITTYGNLHEESSHCNKYIGTVLDVVNDELFTITICNDVRIYEEFSYCYEVEKGDTVVFDWGPENCEFVSFTVVRTGVQCGVLCQ